MSNLDKFYVLIYKTCIHTSLIKIPRQVCVCVFFLFFFGRGKDGVN